MLKGDSLWYFRSFALAVLVPRQASRCLELCLKPVWLLLAKLGGSSSSAVQRASREMQTSKICPLRAVAALAVLRQWHIAVWHEEFGTAACCRSPCASLLCTFLTALFPQIHTLQPFILHTVLLKAFIRSLYPTDKGFFCSYCKFLLATRHLLSCRFDVGHPCFSTEVV